MKLQITWIIFNSQLKRTEKPWLDGCLPIIASGSLKKKSSCEKETTKAFVGFFIYFIIGLDQEPVNSPNPRHETLRPDFPKFLEKRKLRR